MFASYAPLMATTMLDTEPAAVTHTVEPVITPRRALVAAAVLAAIVLAAVAGWALRGPGATGIDPADCVNPPGPGLWCPAP